MSKDSNIRSLILPFIIGIVLGIIAKFVDGRDFLYYFPVFADIKSQMILWGVIAMATPFCGFMIWQIHKKVIMQISFLPYLLQFSLQNGILQPLLSGIGLFVLPEMSCC